MESKCVIPFLLSSCIFSCAYACVLLRRCHLGRTILYDTVSNLSWSVDARTHGIVNIIENLLGKPWAPSVEVGREVPVAKAEVDCVVSYSVASKVYEWTWWLMRFMIGML